MRGIRLITTGVPSSVGPLTIAQPLPVPALRTADPFLLLHHAGPQTFASSEPPPKIEAHPHRGFEPVTFVFQGSVLHRDSLGNTGVIGAEEVQWITSGSGIMHEEGPTPESTSSGEPLELVQLWINLPADRKMMQPMYQELHAEMLPEIHLLDNHLRLRLVAGTYSNAVGPAITQSPLVAAMGWTTQGGSGILELPQHESVLLYVLGGKLLVGDQIVHQQQLVVFDERDTASGAASAVQLTIQESGRILLLAGEPLREPVSMYGPFVMNTEDQIREAFRDFAGGKFGTV